MKAERDKRASILEAEGVRQSDINKAEGARQAAILVAEGEAQAVRTRAEAEKFREITVAEGEAKAIETVFSAIHSGKPNSELITLRYLDMLPRLADNPANKIFIPIESTGVMGALATFLEGAKTGDSGSKLPNSAPGV